MARLAGHALSQRYGRHSVLERVDVQVESGSVTCVVGPSGAGKSTLIRTLAMLEPPWEGTIEIDQDSWEFDQGRARRPFCPWPKITVVFQQLFLWPHMTLRENILFPLESRDGTPAVVEEIASRFDMSSFLDRYPNEVSVGQRQRAALARAAALQPSYILLDEITAALDVEQVGALIDYAVALTSGGVGLLVATHALEFGRAVCHATSEAKVVFLDEGRVIEAGGPEVLEAPATERVQRFVRALPTSPLKEN